MIYRLEEQLGGELCFCWRGKEFRQDWDGIMCNNRPQSGSATVADFNQLLIENNNIIHAYEIFLMERVNVGITELLNVPINAKFPKVHAYIYGDLPNGNTLLYLYNPYVLTPSGIEYPKSELHKKLHTRFQLNLFMHNKNWNILSIEQQNAILDLLFSEDKSNFDLGIEVCKTKLRLDLNC